MAEEEIGFRRIRWYERLGGEIASFRENIDGGLSQLLFFVAFVVWAFAWFVAGASGGYTSLSAIMGDLVFRNCARFACFAVLVAREVLFERWDKRALAGLVVFAVLAASSSVCGKYGFIPDGACLVFAARNVPFRNIAKVLCVFIGGMLLLLAVTSLVGALPDYTIKTDAGTMHLLGFKTPEMAAATYLFIVGAYVVARGDRLSIVEAIALVAVAMLIYFFTLSCIALFFVPVIVILAFAMKFLPKRILGALPLRVVCIIVVVLIAAGSLGLAMFYDESASWMVAIDNLLGGRISNAHWMITQVGISVFGQDVTFRPAPAYNMSTGEWVGRNKPHPVDNAYAHAAIEQGMVFLVLGLALVAVVLWRALRNHEGTIAVVVICLVVYAAFELYPLYLFINPLLFLCSDVFSSCKWGADGQGVLRFMASRSEEGGV